MEVGARRLEDGPRLFRNAARAPEIAGVVVGDRLRILELVALKPTVLDDFGSPLHAIWQASRWGLKFGGRAWRRITVASTTITRLISHKASFLSGAIVKGAIHERSQGNHSTFHAPRRA